GPGGAVYTVTVTATDNCGAPSSTTFQLTVNQQFVSGGLLHDMLGQALLSSAPNGELIVSQLNSDGNNGYLTPLSQSQGYSATLRSTNNLGNSGVYIKTQLYGRVIGRDDQLIATVIIVGTGTSANLNVDFSPLSSPSSRVALRDGNGNLLG